MPGSRISVSKKCLVCGEEFMGFTKTICDFCQAKYKNCSPKRNKEFIKKYENIKKGKYGRLSKY